MIDVSSDADTMRAALWNDKVPDGCSVNLIAA